MTLFKMKRHLFLEITLLMPVMAVILNSQARALTIISPTEGAKVREKVKIVIPRSAVPTDGFVTISVDGKFRAAAALPDEEADPQKKTAPASPYYTYIWDTKAPVVSASASAEPIYLKDGKHEVEVQVHDSIGRRVGIAKVNVNVANRPAMPNPSPPFKLYYRYNLGDQLTYHCKVDGEILDNLGQPMLSGVSAVKSEFDIIQTVEEARRDGSALIRYKIGKDAIAQIYGQQVPIVVPGSNPPSIYKLIDNHGRVLQSNIIRKTNATITDILPFLPTKPVQIGETWTSQFKIKIEGIGDVIPFQMTSKLDSIEWEGGRECAKITSEMTALGKLNIIPGEKESDEQTPIKGTGTFYFAYKIGKLVKAFATLESGLSISKSTLTSLQQGTVVSPDGSGMPMNMYPSEDLSEGGEYGDSSSRQPKVKKRAPTASIYGPTGAMMGTSAAEEKMTVRLRLNWSMDIKK